VASAFHRQTTAPARLPWSAALALLLGLPPLASARAEDSGRLTVTPGDHGTLIFSRPRGTGGEREGLVVDSNELVQALKARVLEARGLGEVAELRPATDGFSRDVSDIPREAHYVFSHRFGTPFESLEASLRLRPLAEPDDRTLIFPLAWLLGVSVVLGLYALYRTTATQIEFAERRNNFVSAVSHELKTPLTAIRMYAEMLDGDLVADDARRRDYYRTITAESERLTRLINNVLELSRIEKKPARLQLMLGDITPVVREALDVLRPHVERERFALDLDIANPLPNVQFESDALRQILFNLIDNALKYSRDATDRRITVRLETKAQGRVLLTVRDRGPGVQEQHLGAIFQPFFRAERELTRKTQGAGIGLSLVRGLVERMGGSVRGANADPGFEIRVELATG
jgi:two-component system, OmpR family, phosphate regulon sensor histidine kinase PhoR